MFLVEVGLPREKLADKVVLDAGCGNGQLTDAIGSGTAMCIGLDFSTSVFLAEKHRTSDRTHFVQGDLSNPPFEPGVFDLVYCSGVLHHNRDARSAFASVSRLVKEKGLFFCWLYRFENSPKALFYNVITEIIRPFASRAPSKVRDFIAKAWAAGIFSVYRLMGRRKYSYQELVVGSYDVLTPRYASRHTPIQMAGWFHENGFGAASLTHWDNPNGFGMVARRTKIEETPGIHFGQAGRSS
jgi:SAM-dependent methyltransferase